MCVYQWEGQRERERERVIEGKKGREKRYKNSNSSENREIEKWKGRQIKLRKRDEKKDTIDDTINVLHDKDASSFVKCLFLF